MAATTDDEQDEHDMPPTESTPSDIVVDVAMVIDLLSGHTARFLLTLWIMRNSRHKTQQAFHFFKYRRGLVGLEEAS